MRAYNFKNKVKKDRERNCLQKIKNLYNKLPDTQGCIKNINLEEGSCNAWCCFLQNPQLLYIEFVHAWKFVLKNFSLEEILLLFERALNNYLFESFNKPCIFFDRDSKKCLIHNCRPLTCRLYGITPKDEFQRRKEKVEKSSKEYPNAIVKDQCNLVSTTDGSVVTEDQTCGWTNEAYKIENEYGIRKDNINDLHGGSYRTFHDHLLLNFFDDEVMAQLTTIRESGRKEDKEETIINLIGILRKGFSISHGGSKEG